MINLKVGDKYEMIHNDDEWYGTKFPIGDVKTITEVSTVRVRFDGPKDGYSLLLPLPECIRGDEEEFEICLSNRTSIEGGSPSLQKPVSFEKVLKLKRRNQDSVNDDRDSEMDA